MTVVRNLLPFTNYSIAVSASTSAGEGPRSDVTVAMTAEGSRWRCGVSVVGYSV